MSATQGRPSRVAVTDGVTVLEDAVEDLGRSLASLGVAGGASRAEVDRLRGLRDELASHALAARVLVRAGASDDAVAAVLARADALLVPEPTRARA